MYTYIAVWGGQGDVRTYAHTSPTPVFVKILLDLDPWALGHPPIFTQKLLKAVTSRLYHLQITVKSVHISIFGLENNAPILKYLSLKIRSEPFFHFSKMAASSCIDN